MNSVLEGLVLFAMRQLITPELVQHLEDLLIAKLRVAAASTETRIDDAMVDIVIEALHMDKAAVPV